MTINLYNEDCMKAMADMPDDAFELAIVDPPYGIGMSSNPIRQKHVKKHWDDKTPDGLYFKEIKRVSENQIIWGGNYFTKHLNNNQCFLIWDKMQSFNFSLAMCEYAWTSFSKPAKMLTLSVLREKNKIHPTQKPVKLYEWILKNYAKEGDKILDTHLGSGSIAIACHNLGYSLTGYEIDKDYYDAAVKRYENHASQMQMFV